jgi:hypothetical protein
VNFVFFAMMAVSRISTASVGFVARILPAVVG